MAFHRSYRLTQLSERERRLLRSASHKLRTVTTRGAAAGLFAALRECAPVVGGIIGAMRAEVGGSMVSHAFGLPLNVLEGWASAPPAHLERMLAPLMPAEPGQLVSDRTAIVGPFREKLELLEVMRGAGLGEAAGYKVAVNLSDVGQREHRFVTLALDGGQIFTQRQRDLFLLLQPAVKVALDRLRVPIIASQPVLAQILEERMTGFVCLSQQRRAIVEMNQRAYVLISQHLRAAQVEAGRGCLERFAEKAFVETSGGRTWYLPDERGGWAAEVTVHWLSKAVHDASEDLSLIMIRALDWPAPTLVSPGATGAEQTTPALTKRQTEIAELLISSGLSYKQIADRLAIAEGTMRKHAEKVYRSYGVHSRAELALKGR